MFMMGPLSLNPSYCLLFYRQIIKDAPEWLRPEGFLILEAGEEQAKTITKLIETEGWGKGSHL